MIDELRSLAIFATVVDMGSFRGAAKALALSPSVVSHHITQLELRLGVALLYRSTRQLSLTHEGEILYEKTKIMLAAAEQGLDAIAPQVGSPSGKLTISIPSLLIRSSLMKDIATFAKEYYKLDMNIQCSDIQQDIIREGIDVAIRIGNMSDSTLKAKKLYDLRRKLVVSPDMIKNRTVPQEPYDLLDWEWIGTKMRRHNKVFVDDMGDKQEIQFKPRIIVDSIEAMRELAIMGLGLATPPEFSVIEDIEKGRLVTIIPNWNLESLPVYAVWPANVGKESLTCRFISYLEMKQQEPIA